MPAICPALFSNYRFIETSIDLVYLVDDLFRLLLLGKINHFMIQWIISKPLKALAAIKRAIALMLLGWSEKNSHQVPQLRIDSIVSWFMQRWHRPSLSRIFSLLLQCLHVILGWIRVILMVFDNNTSFYGWSGGHRERKWWLNVKKPNNVWAVS